MEIIKGPSTVCECAHCKCQFRYDEKDVDVYKITKMGLFSDSIYMEKRVDCPACHRTLVIQRY